MSEPLGVSHGRIGGGADAPSGRKARRAAGEMRFGVIRRGEGPLGTFDGVFGTGDDGVSVTEVGDGGLGADGIT